MINLAGHEANLHPLTLNRPIAALPYACRYRIIDFMLSSVEEAHIDSVALFIEESGRSIYDHIRNGREWDLDGSIRGGIFTFSQQRRKLADYLVVRPEERYYENQRIFANRAEADYILVMEGDTVHNVDVSAMLKFHEARGADITVAYKSIPTDKVAAYNLAEYYSIDDEDYLESVLINHDDGEKRHAIDGHVYLINKSVLFEMFDQAEEDEFYVDLGSLVRSNLMLYKTSMYEYTGFIAIVNSIQTYFQANMAMLETTSFNALFKGGTAIITRSKSGVPTYYAETANVHNAQFATGCIVEGSVNDSLVSRKSHIAKDAVVSNSILASGVKIGEGARVEYAILDKGVVIDPGVILKGTLENPIIIEKCKHIVNE